MEHHLHFFAWISIHRQRQRLGDAGLHGWRLGAVSGSEATSAMLPSHSNAWVPKGKRSEQFVRKLPASGHTTAQMLHTRKDTAVSQTHPPTATEDLCFENERRCYLRCHNKGSLPWHSWQLPECSIELLL